MRLKLKKMENTLYYDLGDYIKFPKNITDNEKKIVNNLLIELGLDNIEYTNLEISTTPPHFSNFLLHIIRCINPPLTDIQ